MKEQDQVFMAHVKAGDIHSVIAELRVLVMPTEGGYFAQGLEIDYVATGETEEEVKERFAEGFVRTVHANIRRGRGLNGLFKSSTPPEHFQSYLASAMRPVLSCQVAIQLPEEARNLIPSVLSFLSPKSQSVCA